MAQTFNCPSCGASLDYDGGDDPVIRCAYCKSTVIVPEELRPAPPQRSAWTATPIPDSPLTIDLSGMPGRLDQIKAIKQLVDDNQGIITTLKTVKELVRDGQEAEAARLYQETFGVSDQEAKDLVNRLAAGQSVVLSSTSFSTSIPVVSGTQAQVVSGPQAAQAAQFWREQIDVAQQQQRKRAWVVYGVVALLVIVFLVILFSIILGAPLLCGILGASS
ncbi:MAG: hypothetical protein KKA73_29355 [Chloroflexi bacterium]|nr:hypothetical protein [Chloroflexota bacterium]MBU1751804.1 hypothetical protein [Chloroflexota bacterium]